MTDVQTRAQKLRDVMVAVRDFAREHRSTVVFRHSNTPSLERTFVDDMIIPFRVEPRRSQFRFPKSKKQRIQKKWAMRDSNWGPPRAKLVVLKGRPSKDSYYSLDIGDTLVLNRVPRELVPEIMAVRRSL